MANSQAFAEAVELAKQFPRLKIGCYVVLIDETPIRKDVPSLTNGGARFRTSLKGFAQAAVRKRISADEIEREAEAQICKLQAAGIDVTHVDTHKHTHLFPHVLRAVIRAAKTCGVRAIRNPFEPRRARPRSGTERMWLRSAGVAAFRVFERQFRRAVTEENMITTGGTVGIVATGKLNQEQKTAILNTLPEGTWELVCHPGYCDPDLRSAGTRLLESRHVELQALESVETEKVLADRGIELISYADLKES